MSPHPQDSAVSQSLGISTPLILLLLLQNMTVEVTKTSLPSPHSLSLPQTVCILLCLVMSLQMWYMLIQLSAASAFLRYVPCPSCLDALCRSLLQAFKPPCALRLVFRSPLVSLLPLRDLISLGQNYRALHWFVSYRCYLFCPLSDQAMLMLQDFVCQTCQFSFLLFI